MVVLRGVGPVLEVPFHGDESVDIDGFARVVDHVLGTGATSVMFPGYASEFHKLSEPERTELQSILLDRTGRRPDVAAIVAVQDHGTLSAIRRAVAAAEAGADAINVLPPYLLGPPAAAVQEHVAAVLDAVAPLPVVVQYAPAETGTSLAAPVLSDLAASYPNLAAVKVESVPPGSFIAALAAQDPPLAALVGYAGLQLPDALRRGAIGVQPGCSFTELYVEIWRRWEAGDRPGAEALHRRMVPYLSYWMQSVELIVAAEKLISLGRGLIADATCRRPAHHVDQLEVAQVEAFLVEFDDELGGSR